MRDYSLYPQFGQPTQYLEFGGGAPQQSAAAKENERLNTLLLRRQLAAAGKTQEVPEIPLPRAQVFAPPPQQTSQDALDSAAELRRAAARRRGFLSTQLAGATGGFKPAGKPTLG